MHYAGGGRYEPEPDPLEHISIFKGCVLPIIAVLILFLFITFLTFGNAWFKAKTAPFFGWADAEVQIESAESRISNYNYFFSLCSAVQTHETTIASIESQLERVDATDRKERNRLESALTGVTSQRARNINDYNAAAQRSYTSGRFRASNLPFQLDESAERTECYWN